MRPVPQISLAAMEVSRATVVQAAKALGLSRSALYRRLERYGL